MATRRVSERPKGDRYRVLVGLNYVPDGKDEELRREVGDEVTDLPAASLPWLLQHGCVTPVAARVEE